jgi:hypothetical protein
MISHLLSSALLKVNGSQVVLQQLAYLQFVIALLMPKSKKIGESMYHDQNQHQKFSCIVVC